MLSIGFISSNMTKNTHESDFDRTIYNVPKIFLNIYIYI